MATQKNQTGFKDLTTPLKIIVVFGWINVFLVSLYFILTIIMSQLGLV